MTRSRASADGTPSELAAAYYAQRAAMGLLFALEVASATVDEIGPERTAIRSSPGVPLAGLMEGEEGPDLYRYLVSELDKFDLAYLHLLHQDDEALYRSLLSTVPSSTHPLRT